MLKLYIALATIVNSLCDDLLKDTMKSIDKIDRRPLRNTKAMERAHKFRKCKNNIRR